MMFYLLFWRKCFVKRSSSFSRWMALFLQNKQKQGIYFSAWTIQRQDQYQCFTSIRLLTPPALRKHKCRFLEGVCGSRCSPSVVDARGQQAAAQSQGSLSAGGKNTKLQLRLLPSPWTTNCWKLLLCQHLPLAPPVLHWMTQKSTAALLLCLGRGSGKVPPSSYQQETKFWWNACLPH